MNKKIISILLLSLIIFAPHSYGVYTTFPIWSDLDDTIETNASTSVENFLNLESEGAILIEQSTGNVLFEKNSHQQLRPASVTKVMSILLIMEAIDRGEINLTDSVSCSETARQMGGSQIWLDETEALTVEEMLKAICVVSANDCTVAMAEYIAGSEEIFVQKMNERAKELGMNDTTFKNCHGIDEDGHLTSCYDIGIMSRELLNNHPEITNFTTIWMDSLRDGKSELVNTNKLIRTYEGATGLKTGSTSLALYNLSASATRNNVSLIAVVMRSPTAKIRFNEAKKLLDYGFANYICKKIASQNDIVKTISVSKGIETSINAIFSEDISILTKKGNENIIQEIHLPDNLNAPISKGEVVGYIEFKLNDEILKKVDIVSDSEVKASTLWNITSTLYNKWFNLFRD